MASLVSGHIRVRSHSELDNAKRSRQDMRVDYGTLTLVFQNNIGGLEVQNPHTKRFQPVKPIVRLVLHPIQLNV